MSLDYLVQLCQSGIYQSDTRQQRLLADKAKKYIKENAISFSSMRHNGNAVSSNHPMFEACRVGYMHLVQELLDCGASLNVTDEEGRSPLYAAISSHRNQLDNIMKLLQWGANVNLYKYNRVPLLCAFYGMDSQVTKLLIHHGADVNNVNLPSFCFIESLFALNSGMVMMAAGVRFHFENFEELLSLGTEIVLAGLAPRTIYLSGRSFLTINFTDKVMSDLWAFQQLCLVLGFRVDLFCLQEAINELCISLKTSIDNQQVDILKQRLEKFDWIKQFQIQPLPLTYITRIALRSYLSSPKISRGRHVGQVIDELPLPVLARDFLAMRYQHSEEVAVQS
uniref:SOCS box domain-containing protein n=1 Tax=Biomphalaria glabrata TaxID=6526 RepID=A0A2C9LMJ9_BIOGL